MPPLHSLPSLLAQPLTMLAEGSVYELLRRSPEVHFDEALAHATLVFDAAARRVLAETHRAYWNIAALYQLPILAFTDTWRANADRIARSDFADRKVNQANARFLLELREEADTKRAPVFVAGLMGCRGDAYRPEEALTAADAHAFHGRQIDELASSGVDLLFAATLPALSEAVGIGRRMSEGDLPYVLSFVLDAQGKLLDGTPLDAAVSEIDAAVARPPLGYFLNCVHPSSILPAVDLDHAQSLRHRFLGLQANTSALPPDELDGVEDLQTEPADSFSEQVMQVGRACRMSVLGGCCGTDASHIESLAKKLAAEDQHTATQ